MGNNVQDENHLEYPPQEHRIFQDSCLRCPGFPFFTNIYTARWRSVGQLHQFGSKTRRMVETDNDQKQLGKTLRNIADQLRGAMNADDFRDYMRSFAEQRTSSAA